MESVRQILSYNIPNVYEGRAEGITVSLSLKTWTAPYLQILGQNNLTVHPPTNAGLLAMFGVEDDLDRLRLIAYAYPLNSFVDVLSTEGDSVASFHRQITTAVRLAFTSYPFIIERSESGPSGHAPFAETVEHYFSFTHVNRECLLAAGELKNRGIIRRARWYGEQAAAGTEARLGKELRGSAIHITFLGRFLTCLQLCHEVQDSTDVLLRWKQPLDRPIPSANGSRHTK